MNTRPPRFSLQLVAFAAIVLMVWSVLFLRGMFPFGEHGGGFLDAPLLLAFALVLVALAVWLGTLISPVPDAVQGTSFGLRRMVAMMLSGIAAIVLFIVLPPGELGLRLGGRLGMCLQPVRDLQNSPAVAKIAAASQSAQLPEEDWPASMEEWKQQVHSIEITTHAGQRPEIRIRLGSRGSRFHEVTIHPRKKPEDDEDQVHSRWTEDVWLTRMTGG